MRILLRGLPSELVSHFDPRTPLLLGGLGAGEEALGVMQLRLKRHRWFAKVSVCAHVRARSRACLCRVRIRTVQDAFVCLVWLWLCVIACAVFE